MTTFTLLLIFASIFCSWEMPPKAVEPAPNALINFEMVTRCVLGYTALVSYLHICQTIRRLSMHEIFAKRDPHNPVYGRVILMCCVFHWTWCNCTWTVSLTGHREKFSYCTPIYNGSYEAKAVSLTMSLSRMSHHNNLISFRCCPLFSKINQNLACLSRFL